jgi:hypothetical protein
MVMGSPGLKVPSDEKGVDVGVATAEGVGVGVADAVTVKE